MQGRRPLCLRASGLHHSKQNLENRLAKYHEKASLSQGPCLEPERLSLTPPMCRDFHCVILFVFIKQEKRVQPCAPSLQLSVIDFL